MDKIQEAKTLCEEKHKNQVYFIHEKEMPYYVHPFKVADIIKQTIKEPIDMDYALTIAYLHDTLEDTDITYGMLTEKFGKEVADGVLALSKNKALPFKEQLVDSVSRIAKQKKEVAIVKMADRICNILEPFSKWTKEKQKDYLEDSKFIYNELCDASKSMSDLFREKIVEYENKLSGEKNMRYFEFNGKIFAYHTEFGMMIEFDGEDWGLSNYDYGILGTDDRVQEISEATALQKTNQTPAKEFIEKYMAYLSKGE